MQDTAELMQLPWKAIMIFDRQQFQWTLTVCLALAFATTAKGSQSISVMPNDPEGLVGQDMHLWCSVADGGILRDAYFTIVYRNTRKHHRLPANDTVTLNATTVMLTISNLTDAYDMAMVFCWSEGQSEFQVICVGQAPPMPNISYFRYLNWEKFVFEWKIKPKYNGFKTKYTAWFKSSSDKDFTPCDVLKCDPDRMSICIAQNEDNCTVPTPFLNKAREDGYIYFKVNGTNKEGNVTSEVVEKLLQKIVEPGQVKNLKFQIMNGSDIVSYWLPYSIQTLNVWFHVASKENLTEEYEWHKSRVGKKQQLEALANLKPYTTYELSTRVEYGPISRFRSKWNNVTFISHEEVPSQAPKVCGSCFERESNTLTVHFQPLTKEQSRGNVWYTTRLLSLSNGSSVPEQEYHLRYSKGAAEFKLSNVSVNVSYHLDISASTSAGISQSTYINIPTMSEGLSYPTNCTVMSAGDDTEKVVFRWNNVDSSSSSQELKSYTVFWCNGSMNRLICDDPLEWKEVDSSQSSAYVRLTGGQSGYIFGIAATTVNNTSSGIQWSCYFYNIHSVGLSPYIHPGQIDGNKIEIWLSKPPYNPKKGFIYGYNLYYAEQGDNVEFKMIYVDDRTTRGVAVVEGLASGKSYRFKAESLTLAGPSDVNSPMKLATKPFSLSSGEIAGIAVSLVVLLLFAIVGCIYCLRCPIRIRKWFKQFQPCTPEVITEKSNYHEQYTKVPPDYCAVVEISSKDDDQPNGQYNEEGDTVSNYSAVKSNHGCVSFSEIKMPISSLYGSSSVESHLTNILPPLEDDFTKPGQTLQVVSSSLSDRFDNSSDTESDSRTISRTTSSDSREHAFLVPDNSRINTSTYVGRAVSRVVSELSDKYRLLPSVTERRQPRPSLLPTTQGPISSVSPDGHGLDVFESLLSVLPQTTALASSVLPSVEADERTANDDSANGNVLPKIGSNLFEMSAGDVGALCEVSSSSEDGSGETEEQILSTGLGPVDPPSLRSSLSGYSSRYDGTESLYVAASERTDVTPTSNPDDEGIYL